MAEKKRLRRSSLPRCRKAGKYEKSRILDGYLALSGGKSRKYAISRLKRIGKIRLRLPDGKTVKVTIVETSRKKRVRQPCYDTPVADMRQLYRRGLVYRF
jgi:hypothetical protein